MKYEIIFKSGKIKNVVSKDVNKIKNYITESFNDIKSVKRLNESVDKKPSNSYIFGFDHDSYEYITVGEKLTPKQIEEFKKSHDIYDIITPKYNLIWLSHDDEDITIEEIPCNSFKEFKLWLATTKYKEYKKECEEYGEYYDKLSGSNYDSGLSPELFAKKVLEGIKECEVDGDSSSDSNIIDLKNGKVLVGYVDLYWYDSKSFQEMIDDEEYPADYESEADREIRLKATINDMSEEEQIKEVSRWGHEIQYIKNPSEKVQLAAIKRDSASIESIKNPTEKAQWAAINDNAYWISFIKNPSEKMQSAAVKAKPTAIKYIKNPSEELQLMAVEKDPIAIIGIENPSEKVQLAAVKKMIEKETPAWWVKDYILTERNKHISPKIKDILRKAYGL